MSGKRLCVVLLLAATIFAMSAAAQDEKNEIGGILGRTFISDQTITGATYPGQHPYGQVPDLRGGVCAAVPRNSDLLGFSGRFIGFAISGQGSPISRWLLRAKPVNITSSSVAEPFGGFK